MTENKTSNNSKSIKINIEPAIISSISNEKAKNFNNLDRENIVQNLKNKIDSLKTKSLYINSLSINKDSIKNSIVNKKTIKPELDKILTQKVSESTNLYNSNLTFSSLIKGLNPNINESYLNNLHLKSSNISEKEFKISSKVESKIKYASNPKLANSGLFMSLNSTHKFYTSLIDALSTLTKNKGKIIKSSNQNLETDLMNENNKVISYKIRHFLNLITKYDFNLSTSYYDFFQFNKSNKYLFEMEKAAELLNLAFLAKGCLISKPIFNVVYPQISILDEENDLTFSESKNKTKITIHLFYYIKTNGLLDETIPSEFETTNLAGETKSNNLSVYTKKVDNLSSVDFTAKKTETFSDSGLNHSLTTIFDDKFTYLCDYLTKLFNTEVELDLVRLYRPYQDSNILVQFLNTQSYNRKFIRIVSKLFKKIKIYKRKNFITLSSLQEHKDKNALYTKILNEPVAFPSGISGINIKLAGRPFKERIVPRFTVKRAQRGNFDRLNVKMIEKSMFTDKTKKGAFNFTVRLSHIFR